MPSEATWGPSVTCGARRQFKSAPNSLTCLAQVRAFFLLPKTFSRGALARPLVLPRPVLRFLPKHLPVSLAIGIKAVMFTLFPSGFQFGPSDIPVRTAFPQHSPQVLPKLFDGRSAKKPVAVIDLEYNETRFEDDDMRDHRIVLGVRVLGDLEILLNLASRIG